MWKNSPGRLIEILIDYISQIIYRYIYTSCILITRPRALCNACVNSRLLTPGLFWLLNVFALEMYTCNISGGNVIDVAVNHTIDTRLLWPGFDVLGLFLGNILFSTLLTWGIKNNTEWYFRYIWHCVEYGSVFYVPYAICCSILSKAVNSYDNSVMILFQTFIDMHKSSPSFLSTESSELGKILMSLPFEESFEFIGLILLFSFVLWGFFAFAWLWFIHHCLNLQHHLFILSLTFITIMGLSFFTAGIHANSFLKEMNQATDVLSNAIFEVKREELQPNRNYLKLGYLCNYISTKFNSDEKNQFKYEVLSVLFKQISILQDLGYDEQKLGYHAITTEVNSLSDCSRYLQIAETTYQICESQIEILEKEKKMGINPGDIVASENTTEYQVRTDNPIPSQDYYFYSTEMMEMHRRIEDAKQQYQKISSEGYGDYIYPEYMIPVDQPYEVSLFARFKISIFPFFICA